MPQLQPYVSNVPLVVAENLRFKDDAGIPVTQMLPVGMNGTIVADNPRTGYISRIGAILSDQIDLYNNVNQTLKNYGIDISNLDDRVAALELSGTTMPYVNGACFNGNEQIIIQDAVQAMIDSACEYYAVMGTASDLTLAILAEAPQILNVKPAYSQGSAMAGLSGWESDPETIANTINNLWLAYLDSRAGLDKMLSLLRPVCSEAIIDFLAQYSTTGPAAGFSVYFSGYSFIPSGYTDNGSTVTISDGIGGVFTTGIDIVARSTPGADPLFVGISGTPLDPDVPSYSVTLNSAIVSGSYSCSKTVIHNTATGAGGLDSRTYAAGVFKTNAFSGATVIAAGLSFIPVYANIVATDVDSAAIVQQGYFIEIDPDTGDVSVTFTAGSGTNLNIRWAAFK